MAGSDTALTGRLGKFVVAGTRLARTTKWNVSKTLASKSEWGDSDSAGYTNRAPGRKDGTFDAEGKYDTGVEAWDIFQPGDIATAVLWMNDSTLYWYFGRAMNEKFDMEVNMDTQEVIGWTSSFGADGKFYFPGEAGAPAATLPA